MALILDKETAIMQLIITADKKETDD